MGFDINGVKLLIKAKQFNVNFEKVITIGRQGLHLSEEEMRSLLIKANLISNDNFEAFKTIKYTNSFLELLGAKIIDSLDVSDYEEATIIHDLNLPLPNSFNFKYTLLIDGGSLEHIFNFPVAIKNCMELIQLNGYYIGITPTNNFLGHGFYQFSPELYYRIFSQSNGFRVIKMYFYVDKKDTAIYEVLDPLELRQRVTMVNMFPSYLFVIAQKIEEKEVFKEMPQQSDYEHLAWKKISYGEFTPSIKQKKLKWIKKFIPSFLKKWIMELSSSSIKKMSSQREDFLLLFRMTKPRGISNPSFIKKIEETDNKRSKNKSLSKNKYF
jgi:hypothetical protein